MAAADASRDQQAVERYTARTRRTRGNGADEPKAFNIETTDAEELVLRDMPPLQYITKPWLCEGVTLLVGRPKLGKTTLGRQLAVAARNAGSFLTSPCSPSTVLFLSLEEGERLMKDKLARMGVAPSALRGISLKFEWPRGDEGVAALRQWMAHQERGRPVLIIIDSLTRFRMPADSKTNQFVQDYEAVKGLADLCKDFPGLAVLVLHHTRKGATEDPVDCISGTYGLSAAADNYLIVLREREKYRLHAGGRTWMGDANDFEIARAKAGGGWELLAEWDDGASGLSPKQREVYGHLLGGAKTRRVLAELMGMTDDPTKVSHLLKALEARGKARPVANGWEVF